MHELRFSSRKARKLIPGLFILPVLVPMACSSGPELHAGFRPVVQGSPPVSGGQTFLMRSFRGPAALLFSYESSDLVGDFLLGASRQDAQRTRSRLPDAFPVFLRVYNRGRTSITLRPANFRLEKGSVSVPPLIPTELIRFYETDSMKAFPFEFRVVPVRQGLFLEGEPSWKKSRGRDTASPAQDSLRRESRATELQKRFQMITLKEGDSVALALFFRLIPPDNTVPYRLKGVPALPEIVFYFSTGLEAEIPRSEAFAFTRAFEKRLREMERDRTEWYDIHRQLHRHADLTSVPSVP